MRAVVRFLLDPRSSSRISCARFVTRRGPVARSLHQMPGASGPSPEAVCGRSRPCGGSASRRSRRSPSSEPGPLRQVIARRFERRPKLAVLDNEFHIGIGQQQIVERQPRGARAVQRRLPRRFGVAGGEGEQFSRAGRVRRKTPERSLRSRRWIRPRRSSSSRPGSRETQATRQIRRSFRTIMQRHRIAGAFIGLDHAQVGLHQNGMIGVNSGKGNERGIAVPQSRRDD